MPFYRCIVPQDSVPFEKREEVATAFTDIHCGSTGAPRSFVHVVFDEVPAGADSDYPTPYYVDGGNRAGRPEDVKQKLLDDLTGAFIEITGVSSELVAGRINESPRPGLWRAVWSFLNPAKKATNGTNTPPTSLMPSIGKLFAIVKGDHRGRPLRFCSSSHTADPDSDNKGFPCAP